MLNVIASFDDGSAQDMRVAQMLAAHNIPAIFYLPVNWIKVNDLKGRESLSIEQVADIASFYDIGSHTVNHPHLTKLSLDAADYEITSSKTLLEQMFARPVTSFCYPRGYYNDEIKDLVQQAGYTNARTVGVGALDPGNDPYAMPTTVHVGCQRKEYGSLSWLEFARQMIDKAHNTPGHTFHFFGHGWELEKNHAWDDFATFLSELA